MNIRQRLSQQYDIYVARSIAMDVLSMSKEDLIIHGNDIVDDGSIKHMDQMMQRCYSGEPLAYVLGYEMFCGYRFNVNKYTLIPRPETEELVDLVVADCGVRLSDVVVDMGTGSGCVGLSVAKKYPDISSVLLCDVSEGALSTSHQNALSLGIDAITKQVDVMKLTDDDQGLDCFLEKKHHVMIVANLPYIPDGYVGVEEDVQSREPHLALYSGADGLDHYRGLLRWSRPGRTVWMEMMTDQVAILRDEFGDVLTYSTFHPNIVMVKYCS